MTRLRIVYTPGQFFLMDSQIEVSLDGAQVCAGGIKSGIDFTTDVSPAMHTLETRIGVGPLGRKQTFELDLSAYQAGCEVHLNYDNIWGNFDDTPTITATG